MIEISLAFSCALKWHQVVWVTRYHSKWYFNLQQRAAGCSVYMIVAWNNLLTLLALNHVFSLQCMLVTAVYAWSVDMGVSRDHLSPPPIGPQKHWDYRCAPQRHHIWIYWDFGGSEIRSLCLCKKHFIHRAVHPPCCYPWFFPSPWWQKAGANPLTLHLSSGRWKQVWTVPTLAVFSFDMGKSHFGFFFLIVVYLFFPGQGFSI